MFDFVLCPLSDFGSTLCIFLYTIKRKCDKNSSLISQISEDNTHQNCNDLNHLYYLVQRTCIGKQISTNMKLYTHTHKHLHAYSHSNIEMYFNVHTLTCIHGDVCNSYLILCPFFSPSFLFSFLTLSIPPPPFYENNNSFHHHIRGVVLSLFFSFKSCHSVSCSFIVRIVGHVSQIHSVSFVTLFRKDVN